MHYSLTQSSRQYHPPLFDRLQFRLFKGRAFKASKAFKASFRDHWSVPIAHASVVRKWKIERRSIYTTNLQYKHTFRCGGEIWLMAIQAGDVKA